MKILIILYFLYSLLQVNSHCIQNNRSTYVIPSADECVPSYDVGGDYYYFGPVNIMNFLFYEYKCMFAKGRSDYCIGTDGHFCGLQDQGPFNNYFLVEC